MIAAKAYAKINWALDILATRENGYHEMDMLMQSISVYDTLTFEEAEELTLLMDGRPFPEADKYLIFRAARLLKEVTGCKRGARIDFHPVTPVMAGLGGGSADCAAAMRALNELWELNLPEEKLLELGFSLGADVAFCLMGGLQRVRGLGEKLEALQAADSPEMLLIMPDGGLSTGLVFGEYDRNERSMPKIDMDAAQNALCCGDYEKAEQYARNALTEPAMKMSAAVGPAIEALYEQGAVMARMSGSGSAVFGVFRNAEEADAAQAALAKRYDFCERIHTRPVGVEMEKRA